MKSPINILVNKMWKYQWKIIDNSFISSLFHKIVDEEVSNAKIYKITHTLKNKGYLLSLKKNCFLVTSPTKSIDEEEVLMNHYRELLKKHCQTYLTGNRYIWWFKSLELHVQNYEIPDSIDIVNTQKNALEVVVFDKTVVYKRFTQSGKDILPQIKKYIGKIKIGKYSFPLACIELAMLESLHNPSALQLTIINEYIKKILRKHKKNLNFDFFERMLTLNKHHVGVNRIYQLSKAIDPLLANKFHALLKKYSFIMNE